MNADRGNRKFGAGSGNASAVAANWYPGDEWKGDAARIIMYMYLRYGSQCLPSFATDGTTNAVDANMINLLLEWNAQDPVSTIEDNRNNYHANTANEFAQGNRNPFIDNPFLATVIWGGPQATNRWGANPPADTEAPTVPTNLVASNETATTVDLSWTASTDNNAVVAYNIYVDNAYYVSTNSAATTITVTGLNSDTTYAFSVLAADLANNTSALSTPVNATTLAASTGGGGNNCVLETFENIPASNSGYFDRTWTGDNGGTWNATRARTDETINTRSIAIDFRDDRGSLTAPVTSGGIGNLTVTLKRIFSGGSGLLDVFVNDALRGTIAYTDVTTTVSLDNINIEGDVKIQLFKNSISGDRVSIDDLSWTCYSSICAFETFENIPANSSSYSERSWTGDDGGTWMASRARTDETINSRAIAIDFRDSRGVLTSPVINNGIGNLTVTLKRIFSGGSGLLDVFVNEVLQGTIPYTDVSTTVSLNDINITGPVKIELFKNSASGDRISIDDITWTCFNTLSIDEDNLRQLKVYPNPAKNLVNISLVQNTKVAIEIYDLLGKTVLITEINHSKPIDVSALNNGIYLIRFTQNEKTVTKKLVISK
jgi:hypothetical protein